MDIASIFFNIKVCFCSRGDSNEYKQHTIINIKKGNHPELSQR